jgi:hypothetical protein
MDLPDRYIRDSLIMQSAAMEWFRSHRAETLAFKIPDYYFEPGIVVVGSLKLLRAVALDDLSRSFIDHLEERTEGRGTAFQFRIVVVPLLGETLRMSKGGKA